MIDDSVAGQWLEAWDKYGWQLGVVETLCQIVQGADATCEDRLLAVQVLHEGIRASVLPDCKEMANLACMVMLATTLGKFRVPWWRRFGLARRQRLISDQVMAAKCMIMTAAQFSLGQRLQDVLGAAARTPEGLVS